jgi:DNA-binding transcriptional regulator YiaG
VGGVPVTVVELPRFVRQAEQILPEEERLDLIEHLARNPEAGAVMPGTGGVRKLRWGIGGRGKSGGARIIYYYHNATMPIFFAWDLCQERESRPYARREERHEAPGTGARSSLSGEEDAMNAAVRPEAVDQETPGQSIIAALEEAIAWSRGEPVTARETTVRVPHVDVQLLRQNMRLSQDEFAAKFGFTPASVRNWEQGRRRPEGPARVLLAVIARHPEVVEEALHAAP